MGFWSSLKGHRLNRLSVLTFALPLPVAWNTEWDGKGQMAGAGTVRFEERKPHDEMVELEGRRTLGLSWHHGAAT